jgi:hypothetical protein
MHACPPHFALEAPLFLAQSEKQQRRYLAHLNNNNSTYRPASGQIHQHKTFDQDLRVE